TATRLEAYSTIILGNLAELLEMRAALSLAEQFVHARALKLSGNEALGLVFMFESGPLQAQVREGARGNPYVRECLDVSRKQEVLAPSRVSAYERQARWYSLIDDLDGLRALAERMRRARLDQSETEAGLKKYESGSEDKTIKAQFSRRLEN